MSPLRLLAAVAALLLATPPCFAPPLPAPTAVGVPALERYLPDDTHSVLVYNVKPIVSSPLYKKHLKKAADQFLQSEEVAAFCKLAGTNPLTDVHHVTYVTDPRASPGNAYLREPVGYLLILGRFDEARLHKALQGLAKSGHLQVNGKGAGAVYQTGRYSPAGRIHVGVIDRSAVVVATDKQQIDAVRAKRKAGKSAFKNRDLPALLKQLRASAAVSGIGTEEMGVGVRAAVREDVPGVASITYKSTPLRDKGLRSLAVRVELDDKLKCSVTLRGRDKASFPESARAVRKEVEKWGEELEKARPTERIGTAAVMAKLLKVTRARTAGLELTYQAALSGPAVKAMIDGFLEVFNRPSAYSP